MPPKPTITPIVHASGSRQILATESGTAFVQDTVGTVFLLPAVEDGLTYQFLDPLANAQQPLVVKPQASEHLYIAAAGEAAGKGVVADSGRVGLVLTVLGVGGVGWFGAAQANAAISYEYAT
jgi:hypothetical protein